MTKVHPNSAAAAAAAAASSESPKPSISDDRPAVLTVWRKSLLLNGNGFTVFDSKGNLVFRVDNYASGSKGEIVLMDAAGEPLLTIRRKKLSLGEHWLIYEGEGEGASSPKFSVKKHVNLLQARPLANVTPCGGGGGGGGSPKAGGEGYKVEGSYARRSCLVLDEKRRRVAEIRRKEAAGGVAFGLDVFKLVVEPGFDRAVAMAVVILLDQMFGSKGSLLIKG